MAQEKINIRHIRTNGAVYMRSEDVAAYIRALGETEETDVRERLKKAADVIEGT